MRAVDATDFSQFAQMRAEARANDPEATRKAAKQFEALMLQNMFKTMRAASSGDDVMGSDQTRFYQEMFDTQISQHLAAGKGLGLADMLVRQLQQPAPTPAEDKPLAMPDHAAGSAGAEPRLSSERPVPVGSTGRVHGGITVRPVRFGEALQAPTAEPSDAVAMQSRAAAADVVARRDQMLSDLPIRTARTAADTAQSADPAGANVNFSTPADFVRSVLPHARRAAAALGIPARVLVAQAALETGWGQHAVRQADGRPALNFFGIKADKGWQGERTQTMTHEYHNGQMRNEQAEFRSYRSIADSFDNFVDFLRSNPRYAGALRHGGDAHQFVTGLQQAGYATDPAYAHKIMRIAEGPTMRQAMAQLAPDATVGSLTV